MKLLLLSLLTFVLLSLTVGCSVFGIRTTAEPSHAILESEGRYEVREYGSIVVARTSVEKSYDDASSISFRRLFRYITGDNATAESISMTAPVLQQDRRDSAKIAMTAPVLQQKVGEGESGDRWEMSFVLPEKYDIETAPKPTDPEVRLEVLAPRTVAVLRYSGSLSEESYASRTAELRSWLSENGYEAKSSPRSAGYDPPWTIPMFRRNEVLIDVEKSVPAQESEETSSTAMLTPQT